MRVILQEDNEKRSGKAALIRGWPQGQKGSTILQGNLGRREWTITSKKCYDEFIFVLHATKSTGSIFEQRSVTSTMRPPSTKIGVVLIT